MLVPAVDAVMMVLPMLWAPQHANALLCTAAIAVLLLTNGGCHRTRLHLSVLDEFPWLIGGIFIATSIVATVAALRYGEPSVSSFLVVSLGALALFLCGRVLTTQAILFGRRRRLTARRTLLVGGGPLAGELAAILQRYPQYGLTVEGFVDTHDIGPVGTTPWLGPLTHTEQIIREHKITVILVADGDFTENQFLDIIQQSTISSCELLIVPRLHQLRTRAARPDHIGSIPVMCIKRPLLSGVAWGVKRSFDAVVSALALVPLFPILLACAAAVRMADGPGVLFRQERVGRHGQVFSCIKFRTMKPAGPHESATRWSIADDAKVGKVGRFLRRTSLDELPQLWNILRGDMTFVGPRPERPHFVARFSAEIPHYASRHRVRVGLTGLAQVSGLRGDTPITDRARFDNYYIENWSLWMDTKVLLRTMSEVLMAKGR